MAIAAILFLGWLGFTLAVVLAAASRFCMLTKIPALPPSNPYCLDFLTAVGSDFRDLKPKQVVVIGESNTAMDCARSSIRLGAPIGRRIGKRSDACSAAPAVMHTRTYFFPPAVRPADVSSVYKV